MSKKKYLSTSSDWTFDLIDKYYNEIYDIAVGEFGLDIYPNQIEVISSEQMLDAYSSIALPILYNHWSFGKEFIQNYKQYKRGRMGLAYEVVINSNPCIAYLMEENTMMMQALVIAHASFGHNFFFKNNYLFTQWTDASAILDYLVFAKKYINDCEEKYGFDAVEETLDSCHAIQNYGVDRYKRPPKLSVAAEKRRQQERNDYIQSQLNDLWRTIPHKTDQSSTKVAEERFPSEPQENMLYFIEKNAPNLDPWKREIVRIVRKLNQYFYPQRQTKLMNEGCATFFHYQIMNRLYDKGLIPDGYMLEFLSSHTGVVQQPDFDSRWYSGINPYALGFAMFMDIKRICENPTEEDKRWFPDLAGTNWLDAIKFAVKNFKDESFVQQYLSPKVIRDFHLFAVVDDDRDDHYEVTAIHNDEGYRHVRNVLAAQYKLEEVEPAIQVYSVDKWGDRSLTLRHYIHKRREIDGEVALEVMKHVKRLWGFEIHLQSVDQNNAVKHSFSTTKHKQMLDLFGG